ncbi:MAG: OmpA family protein [Bacteroidota bacterium]
MKTKNFFMKYFALVVLATLMAGSVSSQSNLEKARQMKANFEYTKAIELYKQAFVLVPPGLESTRDMADCYLMNNDTKSAEQWLAKVVRFPGATVEDVLEYAHVLRSNAHYDEAIAQYKIVEDRSPQSKASADAWISACTNAKDWMAHPEYFDVLNVAAVNSENSDFGLIPFNKGFILTSDRKIPGKNYGENEISGWTGKPYLKQYYFDADGNGEPGQDGQEIAALNNGYHNGPGVFDPSEGRIYFTRTKMVKVTKKPVNSDPTSWYDHSKTKDFVNRLEIYTADYVNGKWQNVQPFAFNKVEEYSVGHPALSPDGSVLYFVSDMPGGFGGPDIYFSRKGDDGKWSTPQNAGNKINTAGSEVFPSVGDDGVLYFSSDGLAGMGGLDIFSASGSLNKWSDPQNLKYPINSSKDDFAPYFPKHGEGGYFASARDGGLGSDDIYKVSPTPIKDLMLAVVTKEKHDDGSLALLDGVSVKVYNKVNDQTDLLTTSANGVAYLKAPCGSNFELTGSKEGYFTKMNASVDAGLCKTRHDTVFVELVLEKIVLNKPIVLENIYYDYNKWNIRPDAAIELNKLVVILIQNPSINIELGSHTDCRGTAEYNQKLSQKRAESAVAYIVSNGIDSKRITAKGYGESVSVNGCTDGVKCTEEEYQMNRRTEFKVTSINKNSVSYLDNTP